MDRGRISESVNQRFKVVTKGQTVEVLGTRFNISAYADDDETKTTLVEGSVEVSTPITHNSYLLTPGQQSVVRGTETTVKEVNTEQFTAWKEGLIILERQSTTAILRQLSRWYDVEFSVAPGTRLPEKTLSGEVLRNLPLSELLQALHEQTQLKFERKERRIMISN